MGLYVVGWGSYEGDWVNDKKHGRGIFTWADGDRYEGDYLNGKMNGRGITPGPTGTGGCGVGVVVGTAQEQATQVAAEREVVGEGLCFQGSLARCGWQISTGQCGRRS